MKTFIIDIDNTICETEGSDYPNSKPFKYRIAMINDLYNSGHRIIFWTARGSSSGIDWTELTKKQLEEWSVKYHELNMKKPSYDYWIDDKAISDREFFGVGFE